MKRMAKWAVVVMLCGVVGYAFAQAPKPAEAPKAAKAPAKRPPVLPRWAVNLLNAPTAEGTDPLELCKQMLELKDDQKAAIDKLGKERAEEIQKATAKVRAEFVEKAKGTLAADQKKRFADVLAALDQYRSAIKAGSEAMGAAVGPKNAEAAKMGRMKPGVGLLMFLDLKPDQKTALANLDAEAKKALAEARRAIKAPEDKTNKEAMSKYQKEGRDAEARVAAEYDAKKLGVLTPEQKGQMEELEAALKSFNEKLEKAQAEFKAALEKATSAE